MVRLRSCSIAFASLGLLLAACGSDFTASGGAAGSAGDGATTGRAGSGTAATDAGKSGDAEGGAAGDSAEGGSAPSGGTSSEAGSTSSAGSSGLVNLGGTVGVAGAPPVFTSAKLIDNMEDGDAKLLTTNGDWYVFKDASMGSITPAYGTPFTMGTLSPPRGTSDKAAVVKIADFSGWGAAFGFDFVYKENVRQQYDLGDYRAVRFWTQASAPTEIKFQVTNVDTDTLGGKCSGSAAKACGDHYTQAFAATPMWRQITILFSNLKQAGTGLPTMGFDQQHVYSMFFVLPPKTTVTAIVDDIELVK